MSVLPNISITGLTGISGAGKSTAAKIFAERGFTVVDCDALARKTAQDTRFLEELSARFEENLLNSDKTLDRKKTAEVVFSDKEKNAKYLGVIFPYITYEIIGIIRSASGYILLDAPTLFEARIDMLCDNIVSVVADEAVCIKRISVRDSISEAQARARISSQRGIDFFRDNSDFVVENSSEDSYDRLSSEIDRIIKDIKKRVIL